MSIFGRYILQAWVLEIEIGGEMVKTTVGT